jgi:hypothetical protein
MGDALRQFALMSTLVCAIVLGGCSVEFGNDGGKAPDLSAESAASEVTDAAPLQVCDCTVTPLVSPSGSVCCPGGNVIQTDGTPCTDPYALLLLPAC